MTKLQLDDASLVALEEALRNGESAKVRLKLSRISPAKVPANFVVRLASLARRSGLPYLSLRLLRPLVRPKSGARSHATSEEKAAYALALHRVGASDEALEILRGLSGEESPSVWLNQALVLFSQWNYRDPIEGLEKYVQIPVISEYERLVGNLNLAAAYVAEHVEAPAEKTLDLVLNEALSKGFLPIARSSLELAAQLEFRRARYPQALARIDESLRLNATPDRYSAWTEKWKTVIGLYQHGLNSAGIKRLDEIAERARTSGDSETHRDCEFYKAVLTQDTVLFHQVYVGTPFPFYRERILKLFGKPHADLQDHFVWRSDAHLAPTLGCFDLSFGRDERSGAELKPGQSNHRLLWALARDFYRSAPAGSLFHLLFPGEYFDPDTSRDRLQAIIQRTRAWLQKNKIPLSILVQVSELCGQYQLQIAPGYAVQVNREQAFQPPDPKLATLNKIERTWKLQVFAAEDVCRELELSRASVLTILNWGIDQNRLCRIRGSGKTRYAFLAAQGLEKAS